MEDIRIVSEKLPVIQINFEEVKASLEFMLKQYSDIMVTKESLKNCKDTQKELAGLRNRLDKYRLEKKKEMLEPINLFESQMKELVALVEKVEEPIKKGIKTYDDQVRDANRIIAENIVKDVVVKFELREKYANQIMITDKHTQLTAKKTEVMQDINRQAMELKARQLHEDELREIIQDAVDMENKTTKGTIPAERFFDLLDKGLSHKDVLQEVRMYGELLRKAEAEAEPRIKEEASLPKASQGFFRTEDEAPAQTWLFEVTATKEELKALENFIRERGYFCLVKSK